MREEFVKDVRNELSQDEQRQVTRLEDCICELKSIMEKKYSDLSCVIITGAPLSENETDSTYLVAHDQTDMEGVAELTAFRQSLGELRAQYKEQLSVLRGDDDKTQVDPTRLN